MPPETHRSGATVAATSVETDAPQKKGAERPWRPWPWNFFPDQVAIGIALLMLLFVGPAMGVLIGSAELSWYVLTRLYKIATPLHAIPKFVSHWSAKAGKVVLRDPRDHSYLPWIAFLATYTPLLLYFFWRRHAEHGFEVTMFLLYHYMRIGPRFRFFAHQHVLLHKEGHDYHGMYRGWWRVLNYTMQFWVGPFFGQVPNSYGIAHNKIHHRWHNDLDDVHTNLDLDRTQLTSFLIYLPRFALYWSGVTPLLLFLKRREWRFALKMSKGMAIYYAFVAACIYADPMFGIFYVLFPHFESMIFFGAISYLWHAWVEPDDPTNQYINSVTILDGHDNIWNEDYHVVHHHSPQTHWSEVPAHFEKHKEYYKEKRATIFRDCEEGEMLYWMFTGQWQELADHYVDLSGEMSKEEVYEMLMTRLSFIVNKHGGRAAMKKVE